MSNHSPHIAIYLPRFYQGGIDRAMINLSHGLVKHGIKVDFVYDRINSNGRSCLASQCPPGIGIVNLQVTNFFQRLPKLIGYLQQEQPDALLSGYHFQNEIAILAKLFSDTSTRIVVGEHNQLSVALKYETILSYRRWYPLAAKLLYPRADGIVAVSKGVAEDLAKIASLPQERIQKIYNPVIFPDMLEKAKEPVEHSWFKSGEPPVILGVGRLHPQKDFATLIKAFAQVRQIQPARLLILAEGLQRSQLEELVRDLGLENEVAMPGFVTNPFAYMARAAVFVLSSAWEGFGNVLAEALAVGTPVVSTNCPSGPAEILDNGKYGELVSVGDSQGMAQAILKVLSGKTKSVEPAWLEQFTIESATQKYLKVLGINV